MDHEDYCCRVDGNKSLVMQDTSSVSNTGENGSETVVDDDDHVTETSSMAGNQPKSPLSCETASKKSARKIQGKKSDPKMCYFCNRPYYNQCGLNRHLMKFHQIKPAISNRLLQCPVEKCYEAANTMINLRNHITSNHSMKLDNCRVLKCRNMKVFEAWKRHIEATTCSKYVKGYGKSRRTDGSELHLYNCHRSGSYVSNGKGLRCSKYKGTSKMGATCPSTISAHKLADDSVTIRYYPSHVGHLTFVDEMYLTNDERSQVQALLDAQVPLRAVFDRIIGKTNDRFDGETFYELASDESEDQLIEKILACDPFSNPIASYQPTTDSSPLFLVLMNEIQATALRVWGRNGTVVLDTMSNESANLRLLSLAVVDDCGDAFVCAVCIGGVNVVRSFLEVVASKVKEPIVPNVLMTDDDDSHVAAWFAIMGGRPERCLLSSWHVDALWREVLCKMRRKTQQIVGIYKALRLVLRESVESKFIELTNTLIGHLIDNKYTYEVGRFFQSKFVDRVEMWAFCKRTSELVEADSKLESVRDHFSGVLDRGKLVPMLYALLRYVRDRCVSRITSLQTETLADRMSSVEVSHNASAHIPPVCVEAIADKKWAVKTATGDHVVSETGKRCPNATSCCVRCVPCNACVHTHGCTCLDSVVNFNVCEHVHLVLRARVYEIGVNIVSKLAVEGGSAPALARVNDRSERRDALLADIASIGQQIIEKAQVVTDDEVLIRLRDAIRGNLMELLGPCESANPSDETVTLVFI